MTLSMMKIVGSFGVSYDEMSTGHCLVAYLIKHFHLSLKYAKLSLVFVAASVNPAVCEGPNIRLSIAFDLFGSHSVSSKLVRDKLDVPFLISSRLDTYLLYLAGQRG